MALVNVIHCCLDSIKQIEEEIKDAIIYLDSGCTESFQYLGAFPVLLELGARSVCSLENISPLDAAAVLNSQSEPARKVVVMTCRLLSDAHRYVLRCLSTHRSVSHCTVFTSISEIAHSAYPDSPLGPDAYREYESLLIQDYEEVIKRSDKTNSTKRKDPTIEDEELSSTKNDISNLDSSLSPRDSYEEDLGLRMSVSVNHFPLVLSPFSSKVFVLPSEGSVCEACLSAQHENSVSAGLPPLSNGAPSDSEDASPGATLTAQFLYHFAAKMDLKLEIFSLGEISKTIGKLITDMSSLYDVGRRRRSAGLLLIDRTLDLLTPCSHGDSLVDRIFSSLPRKNHPNSSKNTKGSQSELRRGPVKLKRSSLHVQIPLGNLLFEEDSSVENFRLLESIEYFLRGWNSSDPVHQLTELTRLGAEIDLVKSSNADILNGSFVATDNFHGTPYLEAILDRRTKDGAVLIRKWLQESLRKENISPNVKIRPGIPSKVELKSLIKALTKTQSSLLRNKGIIQLAAATLYSMDESHSAKWDAFISAEKMLNVSAGDTSQSLGAQISDLISKSSLVRSQGLLSFQDSLLLMITGFILAGENFPTSGSGSPFSWQEEHFLKEAIIDAVLENPEIAKLKFLDGLKEDLESNIEKNNKSVETKEDVALGDDFDDDQWGNWGDEEEDEKNNSKEKVYGDMQLKLELRDRVDNLFRFLHKLANSKSSLLLKEGNYSGDSYVSKGFVYKVLSRVLGKYDVPHLEYHSSTVGRLFKSGFGRFGIGQAKPSLADQNIIVIFVVGGITAVEVREIEEAISESGRPDTEVIIGGTTLLTPNDMFDLLLGDSSYI